MIVAQGYNTSLKLLSPSDQIAAMLMRKRNHANVNKNIRHLIAIQAAKLMYEEGVDQYLDAKRMAAKRLFGKSGKKVIRHRPKDMPSNGEISAELTRLARFVEGSGNTSRLFAMRVVALGLMADLEEFYPRLIGSVSTGRVRKGSDIDLHIFSDSLEPLERHLKQMGWEYETRVVSINKGKSIQDYTHIFLFDCFPIELSVYPLFERRIRGRSSTDGRPILRMKSSTLLTLIEKEHAGAWSHYIQTGELPVIDAVT